MARDVSRRSSRRRRRLEIFNFFSPLGGGCEKLLRNRRRRLENFRPQCRRLKFFQDIFEKLGIYISCRRRRRLGLHLYSQHSHFLLLTNIQKPEKPYGNQ